MATDKTEDENGRQRSPERSDFICSYTEEKIKQLDFIELSDILKENDANYENLGTETEMRELVITLMKKGNRETVKLDNSVTEMIFSSETSQQGAELFDIIFEKDAKRKKCLCDLYDDLKKFMEQENMDTMLIEEMKTEFGNVKGVIEFEKYKNELMEEECPIVVAGETTAGKSSLLNLLLGSDFLPHSLLTCTTTICRLRNKDEKKVLITDKANVTKELDLPVNVDAAWMKSELKKYVSSGVDYDQYNYVDIHWPIPILKRHTIIVDTPGIGSNDELTKRVYEYLCKAVAFIYVINSSNAGGVQSDRLEKIFEVQKDGGKMYDFDPTRTIFVCNKWDQVPVAEEETVWNNTVKKLEHHWPNFSESQMFKLSTKEETRRASTPGLEYTSNFQNLLLGIEKIIPACLEAKVSRHSRWQHQFLEQLLKRIVSRIKLSMKTEDEKKKIKGDIEERIKTLRHNIKQVILNVKAEAEERCSEISIRLNEHMNSEKTKRRIFCWSIAELPNGDNMEDIEYKAKDMIFKRINEETRKWCNKKYVNNIAQDLSDLFNRECKLIDAQCDEINAILLDISMPLDEHLLNFSEPNLTSHDPLFTKHEKIVLAVTSPLWLPLVIGAGLIALPFGVVVGAKDLAQQTKKMNDYNSNKLKYMMDWSDMVLDKYSKDTIYKLMEDTYLNDFNMKVKFVCENVIPNQIAADEKFINNIKNDIRSSCEIRKKYQPLETSCKYMLGKLLLIYMDYFSGYRLSHNEIREGEQEIGKGNFSDVHATEILINGEWIKTDVKMLRKPLENIQSYIQLTEVQNLRSYFICSYTEEKIKQLGFIELSDILEENDANYENLGTETEMRELVITLMKKRNRETVKLDNSVTEMIFSSETSQQGAELFDRIFEKDTKRKKCLCDLYDDLKKFMEQENMDTKLIEEMKTEFGNVKGVIEFEKYKNELMEEECPIVVAGETTAGKSSLLNLLLGSDCLPHSLLTCTTTICRLRNKDEKKILLTDKANFTKEVDLPQDVDAAWMKSELKKYVSSGVDYDQYNYVDIHWPIPILKRHTIIVDTPGIGSNDELTKRVYEYLCKAVAFIYVINSSNAGGVQSDRLENIFEVQKDGGKMYDFDPTITIFVCNKWDQVPVAEEETVWNNTVKKLEHHWPNFSESQMFKLSTKEEARRASTPGLEYTSNFQNLLLGIEKIIPACLEAKVSRHSRWQHQFLEQLLKRIVSRIKLSMKTEDEKRKIKGDIEERIKTLRHNIKQVILNVRAEAEERCSEISIRLNEHMNSEKTKRRIFCWSIAELPNGDNMEVIEYKAKDMIFKRINEETRKWCNKKYVNNITQDLSDLFNRECKLIDAQCDEINAILLDISMPLDEHLLDFSEPNPTSHDPLFTKHEKIVLAVTSPLWLPLVIGAGLIALPFGVVVGAKDSAQQTKKMNDYNSNKLKYMMDWSDMVLDKYSKDTIYKLMEDTYLNDFNMKVKFVCENVIPNQIAADEKFINNIKNDIRSSCEIRKTYQPLETSCKYMLGKLLLNYMDYFSGYRLSHNEIREGEQEIGKGNFSDVHATEILINGKWIKTDVKMLRKPLENIQSYIQLTEVQNLRKLHHPNIVELYGVSYKLGSRSKKFLQIYMEFCDDSLDNIVFNKKSPPPCYLFKEINECKESWEFYLHMMCGVLRGLVHVHGMGIVHRDLKLANILLKNETAKIAYLGLAKQEEDILGTVTGTPTTMAPEVLKGKVYGTQADIFSVGIILWEMWYARPGYTHKKINESGDHVPIAKNFPYLSQLIITGTRPDFENIYKPHHSLQFLMKHCWDSDIIERPTAENVLDKLESMQLFH